MKEIKLHIPDNMRIGEAIWGAIASEFDKKGEVPLGDYDKTVAQKLFVIEDQDLLSLLQKTQ